MPKFTSVPGVMRGHGKTPHFMAGMKSSLIVMYRAYQSLGRINFIPTQHKVYIQLGRIIYCATQAQERSENGNKTKIPNNGVCAGC